MTNTELQIKVKERLNKMDSFDYDNIECYQISEAFNKAQLQWARRQINGMNVRREGDGSSVNAIDDLQTLLVSQSLSGTTFNEYFESDNIPSDYMHYKVLSVLAKNECCPEREMRTYLLSIDDVRFNYDDALRQPSFEWKETFASIGRNRIRVYRKDFDITDVTLFYYRFPTPIRIAGCVDVNTGNTITTNVDCEFDDDIAELILDECVSILAGDFDNFNQMQRNKNSSDSNT